MKAVTTKTIQIRTNDFDCNYQLRPSSVFDLFQGMGDNHAKSLGVGVEDIKLNNMTWVLVQMKYKVHKLLKKDTNSEVVITTWPYPRHHIEYLRAFLVKTKTGELLIEAISKWLVIDTKSRKLSKKALNYSQEVINERLSLSIDRLYIGEMKDYKLVYTQTIHFCDLDANHHVNNTKYCDFVLNCLSDVNLTIDTFEIVYHKECKLGENIRIMKKQEKNDTESRITVIGLLDNDVLSFISTVKLLN
ncbi:MAG: acyl-ACP thioesterase domain-containing protein [Bacilli bacterium]